MQRLVPSRAKLETREGVMEGLARNGIAAAVKTISLNSDMLVAASGPVPSISTTASGVTTTLAPVELTAATNSWSTYVDAVLYPFLLETYMAAAEQTHEFINGVLHVATPKVVPITAEDYLRVATNRLKNVGAMLWSAIRDSLAQGYEAGESTHQLAARIRSVAKDVSEARALTIARTEVISAANAAAVTQVQLGGFSDSECRKQWLATEDERTRATHRLADGQQVGLSEMFSVGGEFLTQPGDPNGRADNVINCRCTVEFVFVDETDAATEDPLVAADGPGDVDWKGWNAAHPAHPKDASGKWTDTDGLEFIPNFGKMSSDKITTWYKDITQAEWDATADDVKAKLKKHANLFYDAEGNSNPKNKIKMLDAGKGDDTTVSTVKPASKEKLKSVMDALSAQSALLYADEEAEKAAKAASVKTKSTPLHVNTNVIYKQTYPDGGVVAVKPKGKGLATLDERIIWNAKTKKFERQRDFGKTVGWKTVDSYGKGEAYKKFSKETGWLTPDSTLPGSEPPSAPSAPSPTKPVANMLSAEVADLMDSHTTDELAAKFDTGELNKLDEKISAMSTDLTPDEFEAFDDKIAEAIGKSIGLIPLDNTTAAPSVGDVKIHSSGDFKDAVWFDKVNWLKNSGPDDFDIFSDLGLEKLKKQVDEMHAEDGLSDQDYGDAIAKIDAALLKKTGGKSPIVIKEMKEVKPPPEFDDTITLLEENSSADLGAKYSSAELDMLSAKLTDLHNAGIIDDDEAAAYSDKILFAKSKTATLAVKVTSLSDLGWEKEFGGNAVAFDAWFAGNLLGKKAKWDQLSSNDRKLIHAAAFNATIFGFDTPSATISKWANVDATAGNGVALHEQIQNMTNGAFAGWLGPNVNQPMWNGLAPETKELIGQKADSLAGMGFPGTKNQVNVFKANDPTSGTFFAPPAPPPPPFSVIVDDNDVSGPGGLTPAKDFNGKTVAWVKYVDDGSGAFIYSVDSSTGGKGNYAGAVDFEDGEVLEAAIDAAIAKGTIKVPAGASKLSPPPPPTPTTPTTPSAPPVHGYNQHVIATQVVGFVGDIGQPKTGETNFKSISTNDMLKEQHNMLLLSDKKKWTADQKSAVSFYGTSAGYRSMNSVLRNDEDQLKKFSEPQLSSAVQSAALVQSSMTPLTQNLILHRGTGAQQFGFKTKSVSTDKLKKLEGQTIVDRGFVSTSVVPPTAISYDYAKKPVKVIIKAPEGTPAVYVDSVKPGHGENELLLGAGTNFHVDEVREATAADKAAYGSHTEQVVTVTIVPAMKVGPKDVSSKGVPSKSATVTTGAPPSLNPYASPAVSTTPTLKSTGTLGGKPGGVPVKLNTNTIYKQSYVNGAVVAVKNAPQSDGNLYRLVWNEPQKKFFLQLQNIDGDWLNAANLSEFKFSKKAAFDKFKNDTDWVTPNSSDTALGTSGWPAAPTPTPSTTVSGSFDHILPGLQVGHKIKTVHENGVFQGFKPGSTSYVNVHTELGDVISMHMGDITGFDSAPSVPTPPAPKAAKTPKFDAAQLQAMHGVPPALPTLQKNALWSTFKYGGTPTTLSSQPSQIFKKLHKAVEQHNKYYPAEKLNLLQALKLIDERAAQYVHGGNTNAYEKKIVDWLQTPSGKTTATKVVNPASVTPSTSKSTGSTATLSELLGKIKAASDISSPHTKKTTFKAVSHGDITMLQQQTHTVNPWTGAEKGALRTYTSQSYKNINDVLRGKSALDSASNLTAARIAKRAQDGMRPIAQDVIVYRRTGAAQFPGLTDNSKYADIKKFEHKVFEDKGFVSTSIHKGIWSGNVEIEIEVPAGTPMAYVGGPSGISHHKSEYEMILASGLRYRVLSVEPYAGSLYGNGARVRLRVEP